MMDTLKEIRGQMEKLITTKSGEILEAQKKLEEIGREIDAQKEAMEEAARVMDADAYCKAEDALHRLNTSLNMYSRRCDQLAQAEIISEEESDAVIDRLLDFEKAATLEYQNAIAPLLIQLRDISKEYGKRIGDAESVIREWTREIRPNRRTFGVSLFPDGAGNMVPRSPKPLPVHVSGYDGCNAKRDVLELFENKSIGDIVRREEFKRKQGEASGKEA